MADVFLDAEALRATTFVRHFELHDLLGSTNNRAAELAGDPSVELPALIAARRQTAGRGRGANTWWSSDGALTFSVLLEPASHGITAASWPQLSLVTAIAICDAIAPELNGNSPTAADQRRHLGIKWPNDVYIDGRKLAGILIESPGGVAPAKNRLVIGVGINVNNSWNAAPAAAAGGIALREVSHRLHDLQSLLSRTLNSLAARVAQLAAVDSRLQFAWRQLNILAGHNVVVEADNCRTVGRCVDLANDGALILETPAGRQSIYSGTVRRAE